MLFLLVYLLTFDYDVVVHALSKVQYGDGKEYLEKIIQIPFEIPTANVERISGFCLEFAYSLCEIIKKDFIIVLIYDIIYFGDLGEAV